jgi:alpha-glucosidase
MARPARRLGPLTVTAQSETATSMLALYRAGLRVRRATPWSGDSSLRWIPSTDSVLAFARGERFVCIVNFGPDPVELPPGAEVLIASNELEGGALAQDTTVWLRQAASDRNTASDERNGR